MTLGFNNDGVWPGFKYGIFLLDGDDNWVPLLCRVLHGCKKTFLKWERRIIASLPVSNFHQSGLSKREEFQFINPYPMG